MKRMRSQVTKFQNPLAEKHNMTIETEKVILSSAIKLGQRSSKTKLSSLKFI